MKIIVLGAGAIGSVYGAKLSKLNNVTLIAKQLHAKKINENGLKLTGLANKIYKLEALTEIYKIEGNTVILLSTKVYDTKRAIKDIKTLIRNDTIVLCMQNGLYSENIVKDIVGNKCLVLRGVTNIGAAFLKPGIIGFNNYGYTAIEKSPISKKLVDNFENCGLKSYVSENIKAEIWRKLIINCVLNPLSAILRVENRYIADEKLNPLKKLIVNECLKVAEKDGVKFNLDFVEEINKAVKGSKNISSMQQDLIKGKKTEIGYLNGEVVELGRKYGLTCPVNEALISIIRFLEKK